MQTATEKLANHTYIPDWDGETCPVHGHPVKKQYTFGMNDAEVSVFDGCRCAVCVDHGSACCGGREETDATYHTDYDAAQGRASLIKMKCALVANGMVNRPQLLSGL